MKSALTLTLLSIVLSLLAGCATTSSSQNPDGPALPEQQPSYNGGSDAALTAAKTY